MTTAQYLEMLKSLGLKKAGRATAKALGLSVRQCIRVANGTCKVPETVAIILHLLQPRPIMATTTFVIRAEVDAPDTRGMSARDWFGCGVNDRSAKYATEQEALAAAFQSYLGRDADGIGCKFWTEASSQPKE